MKILKKSDHSFCLFRYDLIKWTGAAAPIHCIGSRAPVRINVSVFKTLRIKPCEQTCSCLILRWRWWLDDWDVACILSVAVSGRHPAALIRCNITGHLDNPEFLIRAYPDHCHDRSNWDFAIAGVDITRNAAHEIVMNPFYCFSQSRTAESD